MVPHPFRFCRRHPIALARSAAGLVLAVFVLAALAPPFFDLSVAAADAIAGRGSTPLAALVVLVGPWLAVPAALWAFAVPHARLERDALDVEARPNYRGLAGWCAVAACPFLVVTHALAGALDTAGSALIAVLVVAGGVPLGSIVWLPCTLTVTPRLARGESLRAALAGHYRALRERPRAILHGSARCWTGLALVTVPWGLVAVFTLLAGALWFLVVPTLVFGPLALVTLPVAVVCTPGGLAYSRLAKARALDAVEG
ncbi:hypothetical protein MBEHAL_1172 [Halarchaeum acidiphilum MH1-52-1]|uniref:DUF4013 domain-containing protein n=2 Tax=Halarchaeum acidiphilum TaxID=489138 RepID=U2YUJ3_9EURY|nr:hypothetical protein [Halarchaeum acidiphilum]GAD52412.1 hypothetical protein MBEHAL_1172 [Halarchaeum acidiphilum MH1-52-1]